MGEAKGTRGPYGHRTARVFSLLLQPSRYWEDKRPQILLSLADVIVCPPRYWDRKQWATALLNGLWICRERGCGNLLRAD